MEPEILFPYSKVREVQKELIEEIREAVQHKKRLVVHAPTGLGKTIAALAPSVAIAIKEKLNVFFLTSRHTQHKIAIETLQELSRLYRSDATEDNMSSKIKVVDLISKKSMCARREAFTISSNEFPEYCRKLREDQQCEHYLNTKKGGKVSTEAIITVEEIFGLGPVHTERSIEISKHKGLCPYEIAILQGSESNVIVADYYYIFNPVIRESLLKKTKKELEESIIIVDEAHNLPDRVRKLLSSSISNIIVKNAIKEAKEGNYQEVEEWLKFFDNLLEKLSNDMSIEEQRLVSKNEFLDAIKKEIDIEVLIAELEFTGDEILERKKVSYIRNIGKFLEAWKGQDEGFARILSVKEGLKSSRIINLSYRCLDPSLVINDVINNANSIVCMSGTLTPTAMYRDILGFDKETIVKEFRNPFPEKNRLTLIVPEATTKFTMRSKLQFENIARICADITNNVQGNSIVFFPSYEIRDYVNEMFFRKSKRTVFIESKKMSKADKFEMLERFKEYKDSGAVLLAVSSANFAEGIDLPGLLKCVVVVGLPLQKPDLETRELIKYYDRKFGKGWEYGYVLPAITKCLQNAGRCIRSETDRGVIIFLDERYTWRNYAKCFPEDWNIRVSRDYLEEIREFFDNAN